MSPSFQGTIAHRISSSLRPNSGEHPKFAQIYYYDTENELANRARWFDQMDLPILKKLQVKKE